MIMRRQHCARCGELLPPPNKKHYDCTVCGWSDKDIFSMKYLKELQKTSKNKTDGGTIIGK